MRLSIVFFIVLLEEEQRASHCATIWDGLIWKMCCFICNVNRVDLIENSSSSSNQHTIVWAYLSLNIHSIFIASIHWKLQPVVNDENSKAQHTYTHSHFLWLMNKRKQLNSNFFYFQIEFLLSFQFAVKRHG